MRIVGIQYGKNASGMTTTTLHVTTKFDDYYNNAEAGRKAVGERVKTIYAGTYDCSALALKVGTEITVYYDEAVTTSKGTFQNVSLIQIDSK